MESISLLIISAFTLGLVHTALGPDHYLPFIVMAKARNWSLSKTIRVTVFSGLGHVLSSVIIGFVGIGTGIAIMEIEVFEGFRGNIAAWLFVIFGFGYFVWGLYRAITNKKHTHIHFHKKGGLHNHEHSHEQEHNHTHKKNITPWILFTIFFLGPCEPLVPLLMYPAASSSITGTILVALAFAVATIGTMTAIVIISSYGIKLINTEKLERYMHAIAGGMILLSGLAILFLGL